MQVLNQDRTKRIKSLALAFALTMLAAGCSWTGEDSASRAAGTVAAGAPASGSTSGAGETAPAPAPVSCAPQSGGDRGTFTNLVDVRVGTHAGYDRITFEFAAPEPNPGGDAGIPAYELRTAKPPLREDASGQPMSVDGNAFVGVVFHGAAGYDFDGKPTYEGPDRLHPGFDVLTEAAEAGDFEATLSWYLGLSHRACWSVHELHDPDRVVIDFPHS
jgi:hypothetical protein